MSKPFNFSANGVDFGDHAGADLPAAMEAFAADSGYKSWAAMTEQAIENSGAGNIEIRERDEAGRLGNDIAPDQTVSTIRVTLTMLTMGDAGEADAQKWAEHVEKRLREEFIGADIDVRVDNRVSRTVVDSENVELVEEFLQRLWDREITRVFG